jgi:hypothetical protein
MELKLEVKKRPTRDCKIYGADGLFHAKGAKFKSAKVGKFSISPSVVIDCGAPCFGLSAPSYVATIELFPVNSI